MSFSFNNCRALGLLSGYNSKIIQAERDRYFKKTSQKTTKN